MSKRTKPSQKTFAKTHNYSVCTMSAPASTALCNQLFSAPIPWHCMHMRYILFVSLQPMTLRAGLKRKPSVRLYKRNCSTCQMMCFPTSALSTRRKNSICFPQLMNTSYQTIPVSKSAFTGASVLRAAYDAIPS